MIQYPGTTGFDAVNVLHAVIQLIQKGWIQVNEFPMADTEIVIFVDADYCVRNSLKAMVVILVMVLK